MPFLKDFFSISAALKELMWILNAIFHTLCDDRKPFSTTVPTLQQPKVKQNKKWSGIFFKLGRTESEKPYFCLFRRFLIF